MHNSLDLDVSTRVKICQLGQTGSGVLLHVFAVVSVLMKQNPWDDIPAHRVAYVCYVLSCQPCVGYRI